MTEAELYVNALLHYWTLQRHEFEPEDRPALEAYPPRRIIGLGDRADFAAIFTLLARSKSPFSPQDKEDVAWFIAQYRDDILPLLPEDIPSRENLAYLGAKLMRYAPAAAAVLDRHVQTATDVLRLAAALSNGDVSLAEACKFGKFRRAERARMLGWIVTCTHKPSKADKVHLLARPLAAENEANVVSGVVVDVIFQQDRFKVTFDNGLYVYLDEGPKNGQKFSVPVKVECLA